MLSITDFRLQTVVDFAVQRDRLVGSENEDPEWNSGRSCLFTIDGYTSRNS